ncbi:MAG TPA: hypothetical protein ENF94_00415 [Candidatus Woesearchaeota archaeon]|nr:MAG: hypothetical protein DRJ25_05330 [Candidatus Woesearchaeota archaeon]HDD70602.1 hypothetical protein [Candidatus Woesearchaeota archaeon]
MEKKNIILGIWSIIAVTAIVAFTLWVMTGISTTGAYTASTRLIQYTPQEMCELQGCQYYMSSEVGLPTVLSSRPVTVDCLCNGVIRTFPTTVPNLGVNSQTYYP